MTSSLSSLTMLLSAVRASPELASALRGPVADSLDAAAKACEDHPHISHGGQVQVYTCVDMSPPQ